ncbi:MAG: MFS transporter [Clostridia bacterium]|nr:MFS transporter [Clostridia bacterium]
MAAEQSLQITGDNDPGFRKTTVSCFAAYVVQAVVNNFVPLLLVQFNREFGITLGQFTLLTSLNFGLQLCIDLLAVKFIDRIGYKLAMIIAHGFSFLGIAGLSVLPGLFNNHFGGVLICMFLYACGGGLLEVVVSPIVDAIPSGSKSASMSLLHSFYCWGHAGVIALSTLFFVLAGISHWRILALLWSLILLVNGIIFTGMKLPETLPGYSLRAKAAAVAKKTGVKGRFRLGQMLSSGTFWLFFAMMFFSGSSEQSIAQWVSAFAEKGLGVNKSAGDIAGTLLFAVMMGISRTFFGKAGKKLSLNIYMTASAFMCVAFYLCIIFIPNALVKLIFCGLCGFSVGIFWPGTFSAASASLSRFGTPLFALLALAGDLGCMCGPGLVGTVSAAFGGNMIPGIGAAVVFPAFMCILLVFQTIRSCGKIQNGRPGGGDDSAAS